jgi:hypothetical protein
VPDTHTGPSPATNHSCSRFFGLAPSNKEDWGPPPPPHTMWPWTLLRADSAQLIYIIYLDQHPAIDILYTDYLKYQLLGLRNLSPSRDAKPRVQPGVQPGVHPLLYNKCGGELRVKPGVWRPEMWALAPVKCLLGSNFGNFSSALWSKIVNQTDDKANYF